MSATPYLDYLIENEEVANLTNKFQSQIHDVIEEATTQFVATNFEYILENLEMFMRDVGGDIFALYEYIVNFIADDYIKLIDAINEAASLEEGFENVYAILQEGTSDVFTGLGYGAQKAFEILTSTYEALEDDEDE